MFRIVPIFCVLGKRGEKGGDRWIWTSVHRISKGIRRWKKLLPKGFKAKLLRQRVDRRIGSGAPSRGPTAVICECCHKQFRSRHSCPTGGAHSSPIVRVRLHPNGPSSGTPPSRIGPPYSLRVLAGLAASRPGGLSYPEHRDQEVSPTEKPSRHETPSSICPHLHSRRRGYV